MITLAHLLDALGHLWQCAKCGTWSDKKTVNGRCKNCR